MVIHVIEPPFVESLLSRSVDEDKIRQQLIDQIDGFSKSANVDYVLFIESGSVANTITLKAQKTNTDLLVVGSHGKSDIDSDYFGSTTLKLIQNTHIPVLIVKNEVRGIYQEMIAPTNLSDYSKESILFANTLFTKPYRKYLYAFETISELQAMTYGVSDEERESLQRKMALSAKTALDEFMREVGEGEIALIDFTASVNEDLLAYIIEDRADLLVLGSKGVDDLNSFIFGSTASYLMQRSPIDVLVYVPLSTS